MKTILFPTDFSPGANNAFNYAISLSDKLKAKLILFNSVHIPAYAGDSIEDVGEQVMNISSGQLHNIKNKALGQNRTLDIEYEVNYGFAVDNIISIAKEKHADMVIMGTKGATGLKEVFIGSNAAAVIEKAHCPVLVIPENAEFKTLEKIVFATDFCDSDFYTIASLAKIGELFNSEIMIVHVSQIAPTKDYEKDVLEWFRDELKYKTNIEYKNISFHDLVGGNVDYELEDFIEKNKVDLLALSMRKRNIFSKLFERSLTKKMAYHTHIPLLGFHTSM